MTWKQLPIQVSKYFSVKGQIISILGFTGHAISEASTQLWDCGMKTFTDNINKEQMTGFQKIFTYINRQQAEFSLQATVYQSLIIAWFLVFFPQERSLVDDILLAGDRMMG